MSRIPTALALLTAASAVAGCMIGEPEEDMGAGEGLSGEEGLHDQGDGKADGIGDRVCAAGPTLKGIDVSKYQGTIDWNKVKASGVDFAFIRVSDGVGSIDPQFRANWANAKAAGVKRGVYQFFRPTQDAAAQANRVIDAVADLDDNDLPPVIDVEVNGRLGASTVRARIQTWVDKVESELDRRPIIYTGSYFWRDNVAGGAAFEKFPLWIAQYTSLCPRLPSPWRTWTFWQNSDRGRVPGIDGNVDTNFFNGDMTDLENLISASQLNPQLPEDPTDPNDPEDPSHPDGPSHRDPEATIDQNIDVTAYPR